MKCLLDAWAQPYQRASVQGNCQERKEQTTPFGKPTIIPGCAGQLSRNSRLWKESHLTQLQLLIMLGLQPLCMCLCGGASLLCQAKPMVEAVCFQLLSVQGCVMLHLQLLPESILQHTSLCDTYMRPLSTPHLTWIQMSGGP